LKLLISSGLRSLAVVVELGHSLGYRDPHDPNSEQGNNSFVYSWFQAGHDFDLDSEN
jgi:hypothetical protein